MPKHDLKKIQWILEIPDQNLFRILADYQHLSKNSSFVFSTLPEFELTNILYATVDCRCLIDPRSNRIGNRSSRPGCPFGTFPGSVPIVSIGWFQQSWIWFAVEPMLLFARMMNMVMSCDYSNGEYHKHNRKPQDKISWGKSDSCAFAVIQLFLPHMCLAHPCSPCMASSQASRRQCWARGADARDSSQDCNCDFGKITLDFLCGLWDQRISSMLKLSTWFDGIRLQRTSKLLYSCSGTLDYLALLTLFERLTISVAAGSIEKSYIGLPDIASMSQANAVHAMLARLAHSLKRAPEVERQGNTVLNEIIQTIEKKTLYIIRRVAKAGFVGKQTLHWGACWPSWRDLTRFY